MRLPHPRSSQPSSICSSAYFSHGHLASVKPWPAPTPKPTGITPINISHLPLRTCSLKDYLFPETLGFLLSVIGGYCRDHPTLVHIALQPGSFAGVEVPTVSTDAYLLNMWMCSAPCEALSIHEVGECYTHFTDGETEAPQHIFFKRLHTKVRLD